MPDERPVVLMVGHALASRTACRAAMHHADQAVRSRLGQPAASTATVEVLA
jgi:hypothetical protein